MYSQNPGTLHKRKGLCGSPSAPLKAQASLPAHLWVPLAPSGSPTDLNMMTELLSGSLWGAEGLTASVTQSYSPCCPNFIITTPDPYPEHKCLMRVPESPSIHSHSLIHTYIQREREREKTQQNRDVKEIRSRKPKVSLGPLPDFFCIFGVPTPQTP